MRAHQRRGHRLSALLACYPAEEGMPGVRSKHTALPFLPVQRENIAAQLITPEGLLKPDPKCLGISFEPLRQSWFSKCLGNSRPGALCGIRVGLHFAERD